MSNSYDKFLQRYYQYREIRDMFQKDVGDLIGRTQSHCSKMEQGKVFFSFESLKNMSDAGWDVDFMVSGNKTSSQENVLTDYLRKNICGVWKGVEEVLIWIMGLELRKSGCFSNQETEFEYKLLRLLLGWKAPESALLGIRSILGLTQIAMAEKMGVDIKKYSGMEKGKIYPDSGLLVLIYDISYCRPSIFFHYDHIEEYLLDGLWNKMDIRQQGEALPFLEWAVKLYKSREE